MSEEKPKTGKSAGSTKQWKQLGGGKHQDSKESERQAIQPLELSDVQPLERPTIRDARQLNSQAPKRLEVEPSGQQAIQPSKHLESEKSDMPNSTIAKHSSVQKSKQQRDKLTVYLEPDLNDWIRQQVIVEKRRRGHHVEISDLINEALQRMRDNQ